MDFNKIKYIMKTNEIRENGDNAKMKYKFANKAHGGVEGKVRVKPIWFQAVCATRCCRAHSSLSDCVIVCAFVKELRKRCHGMEIGRDHP